LSKQSLTCSMK